MQIQVHLYGSLNRFSRPETPGVWSGELPPETTLRDLIQQIGAPEQEIWLAAIDGKACPLDTALSAGAKVTLVTARGSGG